MFHDDTRKTVRVNNMDHVSLMLRQLTEDRKPFRSQSRFLYIVPQQRAFRA